MTPEEAEQESSASGNAHFRLRLSSILAGIFLTLAGLALAYVGGVMVGRNSIPPAQIKISREELPESEKNAENPEDGESKKILTAEELEFARVLRGIHSAPPKTQPGQPETNEEKKPAPGPVKEETKPSGADTSAEATTQPPFESQPAPLPNASLYDYIFQMGVFKDENSADNLRQLLEGFGLRTVMEKKGRLLVVLVRLRGGTDRAAEVNQIAAQLKLGQPVLRARKAVSP